MRPRTFAALLLALSLLAAFPGFAAESSGSGPNVVFITSDDHRWDALGAAGNPAIHTPVLDRLAAEGTYLRQATVHVSQCLPSRATLVTGLAAHQHGAYANQNQRPEVERPDALAGAATLPGVFRAAGYTTVLVGKWHLAADPWQSGFAEVRTWVPGGGDLYQDPELPRGNTRETALRKGYTQEILTDDAIDFLRGETARKGPFFLWLAYTAPHTPFEPNPPRIAKLYAGKTKEQLLPPGFPRGIPTNDWLHYYEAVSALDEQVGRVLAALDAAGLAGSTVVVFLGDNGFMMGQRGVGAEGTNGKVVPYEGSVRVPFVVRAPGRVPPGPSDLPASTLDVPPTLLALAGLPAPAAWPGRDLLPALRREPGPAVEEAVSEWADDKSERFGKMAYRLVRTPRHKLIVWQDPAKPDELYDLAADPAEETNLAGKPGTEPVRRDLEARLRAWMEKTADPARQWPKLATPP